MSVDITSRPYKIGAACEKCVFGSGEHAEWCEYLKELKDALKIYRDISQAVDEHYKLHGRMVFS